MLNYPWKRALCLGECSAPRIIKVRGFGRLATASSSNPDALDLATGIVKQPPTLAEFETFLRDGHDFHVCADSIVKSAMFRIMRLCLSSQSDDALSKNRYDFVEIMKMEEWYWLIIASLEREPCRSAIVIAGEAERGEVILQDFVLERMQALKLIRCIMQCAPNEFPSGFCPLFGSHW